MTGPGGPELPLDERTPEQIQADLEADRREFEARRAGQAPAAAAPAGDDPQMEALGRKMEQKKAELQQGRTAATDGDQPAPPANAQVPQTGAGAEPTAPAAATGTAVKKQEKEEKLGVGDLPAEYRAALTMRKFQAVASAELAKTNWGAALDETTRRAVANWAERFDVDPGTELDVLGGRPYKKGAWYIRKLSEEVERGRVTYAFADHVENDPRLAQAAADAMTEFRRLEKEVPTLTDPELKALAEGEMRAAYREHLEIRREIKRRRDERIRHGLQEDSPGAVVFRVKLVGSDFEWTGANEAGIRKEDPVGKNRPAATAETRAARRCLRFIVERAPQMVHIARLDEASELAAEELRPALTKAEQDQRDYEQWCRDKRRALGSMRSDVPYGEDITGEAPRRPAALQPGQRPGPEVIEAPVQPGGAQPAPGGESYPMS